MSDTSFKRINTCRIIFLFAMDLVLLINPLHVYFIIRFTILSNSNSEYEQLNLFAKPLGSLLHT